MGALTDEEMRNIGERIARKRGAIGLSQEQFAEALGLSRAAVGKIERGESAPKADTLIAICRVVSNKFTRSKVKKRIPDHYAYIMDELLFMDDVPDRHKYLVEWQEDRGSSDKHRIPFREGVHAHERKKT